VRRCRLSDVYSLTAFIRLRALLGAALMEMLLLMTP
jgi:hypothetical protein